MLPATTTTTTFGAQLLGQTEKALNAILAQLLAGTGLTEPQWVTLTLAVMTGGEIDRGQFISRVAGALKVTDAEAEARIDELAAAQLLGGPGAEGSPVIVTDAGLQLQSRVRTATTEITQRLWGDLPAGDLATAGRVLSTVLDRANAELSR